MASIDWVPLVTAVFSALATALAAYATWRAPRGAAELAERLRREAESASRREALQYEVFAALMQSRGGHFVSAEAVRAYNMIDVAFVDVPTVRDAWADLYAYYNAQRSLPDHVREERSRRLLIAMAAELGVGDRLRPDDFTRVYFPKLFAEQQEIEYWQRQQALRALRQADTPAANISAMRDESIGPFPPAPN